MKRFRTLLLVTMTLALISYAPLLAGPTHATLNWGTQLNAAACDATGSMVVNVNMTIINDADSGLHGFWAYDTSNKSIQIWDQGNGTYCAVVQYKGKYYAFDGATSPGDVALPLSGKQKGTFEGGYTATIKGSMLTLPAWSTHGNQGVKDYSCDTSGNCDTSSGDWVTAYFGPSADFAFNWWGWVYHGDHNTWANSSDGNSGDVIAGSGH